MKKAIIYSRVASDQVAHPNHSIEGQKRLCFEYASKNNYQVVEFASDFGSTCDSKRAGLKSILEFVKSGKGDVLVYSVDRLTRDYVMFAKISKLIKKHRSWLYKKISHIKESQEKSKKIKLNLKRSDEELKELINFLIKQITINLDVKVKKVKYRRMKTRWGSCSSDGNLNFNIYLKYLPQMLIEYIVFHETAHLIELNHNKKFWNIISTEYPDYKEKEDLLFIYWLSVKKEVNI